MKIEQLLVQYLYKYNKVYLQGIGYFILTSKTTAPSEVESDVKNTGNEVIFEYDLRTYEDEGLIDFISKETGKIKPLASADLDSFFTLAKQFLNIGKPFTIEGIGTIQKNQQGIYYFVSGEFITPKLEDMTKQIREKRDESVSFESLRRRKSINTPTLVSTILLILILSGLGLYYLFFYNKNIDVQETVQPIAKPSVVVVTKDTQQVSKVTATPAPKIIIPESSSYNVILKEFVTKELATKWSNKLNNYGHQTVIIQKDSSTFDVGIVFHSSLSDTSKIKDSLNRFFGVKTYIRFK